MSSLCSIIVSSFYNKADLEQWLKPGVLRTDYSDILNVSSKWQMAPGSISITISFPSLGHLGCTG